MALLQISEPGQSTAPHEHRLAAGIDLGTTNSLVATVRSGVAESLADENGSHILPSVVRYTENGEIEVGESALVHATADPLNTLASVKRIMGRSVNDLATLEGYLPYKFSKQESNVPRIETVSGSVTPIEVSAEILSLSWAAITISAPTWFCDNSNNMPKSN